MTPASTPAPDAANPMDAQAGRGIDAETIARMEAAAKSATPGKWRDSSYSSDGSAAVAVAIPFQNVHVTCILAELESRHRANLIAPTLCSAAEDAAHIAAWCPANALAVLDAWKADRERADAAKRRQDYAHHRQREALDLAENLSTRAKTAEAALAAERKENVALVAALREIADSGSYDQLVRLLAEHDARTADDESAPGAPEPEVLGTTYDGVRILKPVTGPFQR